jgi:hypothetical protein
MKAISPYVHSLMRKPLWIVVVITAVFALMTVNALMQSSSRNAANTAEARFDLAQSSIGKEGNNLPPEKEQGQANPVPPVNTGQVVPQAAEVASNYTFSTATTASLTDMSSGTTQLVAADQDDTASAVTNIGFDFYFQGARFSQFSANSNGLIRLGGTAVQTAAPYKPLAQAGQSLITPYGADQRTVVTTGKVHFKVIGSAPNRTLVVEWRNMQSNFNSGGTADLTYQARMSETTGVIEFVYGSMTMSTAGAADVNSRDPNIGFSSSNTAGTVGSVTAAQSGAPPPSFDGSSATAVANLYTAGAITVLTSASQGSRRIFTFTPPTPTPPTTLSFTAITGVAMTLNWVDSPNETIYAVYRSTDGGVSYAFDGTAIQNATSYAATGLIPSTTYFWQVYAVSEGALSTALSGSQATSPPGNITSAASGNWSAGATWTGGIVPTSTDNVSIQNGHTVTIDSSNALNLIVKSGGILQFEATTARTLTVGGAVTINGGGTFQSNPAGTQTGHVLSVGTDLVNNGTLDFSTNANTAGASITFIGAANNTFSGTGATTDIRGITINKGTSSANVLEITTSNLTVRGVNTDVAGFLTLTNGTLKISGTFTMTNRVFTTPIYVIPATGGIWLNNPNFTVAGTNTSTTSGNQGLFRLTQGVYTIGLAIADGFESASATTSYIIEGGTLNANGRFDPQGACTYTQTGGTVNVAVVGNNRSAFGSFEIFSPTATFNMSGGTINLINPSTGATKDDYAMTGQTQNITGGQVVFGGTGAPAASTYATPFGTSFIPNVTVNPTMTWNINNVLVFFRGTTVTNNGAITSTGTSARFDFANAGAAMSYSGSGTFGTLAAPFGGAGISSNSLFLITLNSPIVATRVNLFTGGFVNSGQITLGNGGASSSTIQIGSAGLLTPGGSFDVSPVHNQGTAGQFMIYAQESVLRATGVEINPTRSLNFLSVANTNNVSIAGGDLTCTSVAVSPNNALTLTSGRLITNSSTVILPNAASAVVRTTGYVDGNFRKNYSAAASKSFEVGTANGFSPVTVNATAGTFPATFTVKAVQGPQPNVADPAHALQRYWKLTGTGLTADLTFNYLDPTDIPVMVNENGFFIFAYDTAGTFPGGSVNTVANTATITGVTMFSDWTLLEDVVAPIHPCPTSIDKVSQSFPANGGMDSFMVAGVGPCSWTALSNDPGFITVTSGSGMGNGVVNYTVAANVATTNRAGSISIGSTTFIVVQGAAFLDVAVANPFYTEIGKLSARGITVGCGGGNYCPNDPVTRDQMAAFIMRALGEFSPPAPTSQRFPDVPPANVFYNFVDRMAVLGITVGCGGGNYCPASPVLREQMAAFIMRGLGEFSPPIPGMQRFTDVPPANVFYNFIDRMAVLNITLGCTPNHLFYCPTDAVTRAQMAAFLVRAYNL